MGTQGTGKMPRPPVWHLFFKSTKQPRTDDADEEEEEEEKERGLFGETLSLKTVQRCLPANPTYD